MLLNFTSHGFLTNEATNNEHELFFTEMKFHKCYCIFFLFYILLYTYLTVTVIFFANEGQKV